MKTVYSHIGALSLLACLATACSEESSPQTEATSEPDDPADPTPSQTGDGTLAEAIENYLNSDNLLSVDTVDCTLADGSSSTCYELHFGANPHEMGPFCPATIDDVGGTTVWDGPTHPGLYAVDRELVEAVAADGWDMVDDDGNIYVLDAIGSNDIDYNPCVALTFDETVTKTWYLPVTPKEAQAPSSFADVEDIGVSVDGIKFSEQPSSYENEMVIALAALDRCGGHVDPDGSYHWHQIPEAVNDLYDAQGIREDVRCEHIGQADSALVGWAKDGYPIYSRTDADGTTPDDLDECNGHVGTVPEYNGATYHYHAPATGDDNLPRCLKGVAVQFFGGTAGGGAGGMPGGAGGPPPRP